MVSCQSPLTVSVIMDRYGDQIWGSAVHLSQPEFNEWVVLSVLPLIANLTVISGNFLGKQIL